MRRINVILGKEWAESRHNKMVLLGVILLPLFLVGLALFIVYQGRTVNAPGAQAVVFNLALLYFLVLPVAIPLTIAVYSIVGEKEQGEPGAAFSDSNHRP